MSKKERTVFGEDEDYFFEKALDISDKYSLDELLSYLGIEESEVIAHLLETEFLDEQEIEDLDDIKR